jgi:chromosomal replication initiator protein
MFGDSVKRISTPEATWQSVLELIKENINIRSYNTWFAPTKGVGFNEDHIEVSTPNPFYYEWIEKHYTKLVQNAITQVLGDTKKIKWVVGTDEMKPNNSAYDKSDWTSPSLVSNRQTEIDSPFYTRINDRYVFENFIVGDSNRFAYAAARAVSDSPGYTNYNPLIIYGGTGLGKTHLIQAAGNRARARKPGIRVFYASSETFTSHFINSIQQNKVSEFSAFYRSCDVLLLDDIHFFSNKGKTQEEFFHTFNELHQNGKQIILTSDRPINELVALEERLISRFKWGLIVDVQAPDFETRLAILRNKCEESNLDIPGEILEYLAVNLIDNVRELEGALTRIMAQVAFTAAEPTLVLARSIVAEIGKPDKNILSIESIMDYTAHLYKVTIDQLRAKTRKKDIVKARQVAMYLAKQLTSHSLVTIGLHFGGRDHSTVIHAVEAVEDLSRTDPAFKQHLASMKRHLEYNK